MIIPLWLVVLFIYFLWNILAYGTDKIANQYQQDLMYWFSERLFVLVVLVYVWKSEKEKQKWLRYTWVIITFAVIAALKLIYLFLVLAGVIRPNDFVALMALFFVLAVGFIIAKWEKR